MLILSFYKSINQFNNHSVIQPFIQPFIHSITQPFLRSVELFLFLSMTILLFGCKQTTEPKLEAELKLELEDVSCTEAWIKLTTTNLQLPATVNLLQDGNLSETIKLLGADTLLYVDSLLPNQSYRFRTIIQLPNQSITNSSNELTVTTMDTTSHDFSWQSWEFGQHSSSALYVVAIIDENNIWAVGEIYMLDSLGRPDPNAYNAVHWDGTKWELKRIYFYTFCGQQSMGSYPTKSIFAFGPNDIWIGMDGSQVVRWNGQSQSEPICTPVSINKLWGSSSEDLYAVGNNGNIAHWDGRKWTKIESGTTVNLKSVSGNDNDLFITGYSLDQSESVLLRLTNYQTRTVWYNNNINGIDPYGNIIYSSKVIDNNLFLSSNRGIYRETIGINNQTKYLFPIPRRVYRITGEKSNDVYTVGTSSSINHYNGINKREVYIDFTSTSALYGADSKLNTIVGVGTKVENAIYHKAIIIVGKRN
ncbi:glucosyl transferase [Ignavibacterium sp.]|uniref:glucosyl transferase n=1 Tax=Ignavibacterium sp. TaxID=2651167 RepID=UPI002204996B|nr:glucosyl transferase [Ignavibacterium sp.]BDQ03763.1 MAG: hypothetical protein KatS3mg037_2338 [Ignavibacterium sp.]